MNILPKIQTRDQLLELEQGLEVLNEYLYKTDSSFEDYLRTSIAGRFVDPLKKLVGGMGKSDAVKACQKEIESAIFVKIYIAIVPTENLIDTMSSFVKSTIGEAAILDILVNKELLGGAVVEYKGRILDNSLNSVFEQKRKRVDQIWKNLRN